MASSYAARDHCTDNDPKRFGERLARREKNKAVDEDGAVP